MESIGILFRPTATQKLPQTNDTSFEIDLPMIFHSSVSFVLFDNHNINNTEPLTKVFTLSGADTQTSAANYCPAAVTGRRISNQHFQQKQHQ